jgi:hypothetical protein
MIVTPETIENPDYCPTSEDHTHVLDLGSVCVTEDGAHAVYVDIYCKSCGRSGCIGLLDKRDVTW